MKSNKDAKKSLQWKGLLIKLFEVKKADMGFEGVANIKAYDLSGNEVWTVDLPRSHQDFYWDMKIDTVNRHLIANTRIGYRHIIDPENGKIIEYYLVK